MDDLKPCPFCGGEGKMGYVRDGLRVQDRAFLAKELLIHYRPLKPASGATMDSLRDAGWVERVVYDFGGSGAPFRMGKPPTAWQMTDAGREAIRQCPDIFPGEPVYGRKP